jgi:ATP-dependent DNA ligase
MNASDVIATIRDIEIVPGRNEKAELLRKLVGSDLGRWVVQMAYDPFKTWGLKTPQLNQIKGGDNIVEFQRHLIEPLLLSLSTRETTGNDAQEKVMQVFQILDDDGRDLLYRILSKDLKCGIGESTILLVAPNLIPSFAVMRAQPYEERHVKKWPMKGEFKLDGQRNAFLCKEGSGAFFTRSGKHVAALDFFVPNLLKVAKQAVAVDPDLAHVLLDDDDRLSFMLDGEALMGLFEETGALRRKDVDARGAELHLYDILPFRDFDATGSVGGPLWQRRNALQRFVRAAKSILSETDTPDMIQMVPQYFLNSDQEVQDLFALARSKTLASYLARGDAQREAELLKTTIDKATGKPKVLEGVMVKNPEGLYDKKKSRGWLKVKAEETEDLPVVGAFPGEPGTKYEHCLGGLIVDRNGVDVRVGGGFTDQEREALWQDWQDVIAKPHIPELLRGAKRGGQVIVADVPEHPTDLWGRLIEVEFHEVTPDGSLRHPRFIRFRDDKQGEQEAA